MKKIAFFDYKPYDKDGFEKNKSDNFEIEYHESRLNSSSVRLAEGADAVCAFVNDELSEEVLAQLAAYNIKAVVLRSAGYNNVDLKAAEKYGITVMRVPAYSPHAVAEHAAALLLTLNRKVHKSYIRTRDFNFSLNGLTGMDLYGKTAGVVGTGRIGKCFAAICKGFGMRVLAYDAFPDKTWDGGEYVDLETLLAESDVISLHCPLVNDTYHLIDWQAFSVMKRGAILINTSRGGLIDSLALLSAIDGGKIGAAGLDVYEEEADYFFEDKSEKPIKDDVLSLLLTKPNVIISSHQAFLTVEALNNIAEVTLNNLVNFFNGNPTNVVKR